ncbi:TIGR03986 family CRISPR-associated RAMP protein [Roseovarius sp.]|uniref:TIGR03986 family type III CRISPR-associated RAMP protein n=1 Tax=Roseovarius sp. TaxID=1486281 RepID=UPI003567CC42
MPVTAPFRFARIPRWVYTPDWHALVSHDVPFSDGLSGELPITITAQTPICVGGQRCVLDQTDENNASDDQRKEVVPFRLPDGTYALPPTTLEGMCRSILELAAFGRLGKYVEERWFGLRDFSGRPSDTIVKHYRNRIIDFDERTKDIKPKQRAGWLVRTGDGTRIVPCALSRIHIKDIVNSYAPTGQRMVAEYHGLASLMRSGLNPSEQQKATSSSKRYEHILPTNGSLQDRLKALERRFVIDPATAHVHEKDDGETYTIHESYCRFTENDGVLGTLVLTGKPPVPRHDGVGPFGKGRKKREFVFHTPSRGELLTKSTEQHSGSPVPPAVLEAFLHINQNGRGDAVTDAWQFWHDEWINGRPVPIFWIGDLTEREEGDNEALPEALSMAYGMKLAFPNTNQDLLRNSSPDHLDLDGRPDLPTLIFGMEAKMDDQGHTSGLRARARFDLAKGPQGPDPENLDSYNLVLLSPRPSFFPAYVRQRSTKAGALVTDGSMAVYAVDPKAKSKGDVWRDRPELAGVKLFPVTGGPPRDNDNSPEARRIKTRVRVLPAKTQFETVLRFHNLRPVELGAVLWALTFGKTNQDAGHLMHHIGTAKPYGFGEVLIEPGCLEFDQDTRHDVATCLDAFESTLSEAYTAEGTVRGCQGLCWRNSPQVLALRKAADPRANSAADLAQMQLDDFTASKRKQEFLGCYVVENDELPRLYGTFLSDTHADDEPGKLSSTASTDASNLAVGEEVDGVRLGQRVLIRIHNNVNARYYGKEGEVVSIDPLAKKPFKIVIDSVVPQPIGFKRDQFEIIEN